MTYTLKRTIPNGDEREHIGLTSLFHVGMAVAYCLLDNRATNRRYAAEIGRVVETAPLGKRVEAFGYTFWVVEDAQH